MSRVFVTGGASGFGRALAERYARAGWRVCIGDVHEARGAEAERALRALAPDSAFLRCDVTREADVVAAADWLDARWGGVDVVINNAGVAAAGGIGELSEEDWRWVVDINLLGVARGCRVFAPRMARAGGGHLVNVASLAGLVHVPQMAAYNAAKAAVVALSETLLLELEPAGVRVSVVCPGFFRTTLTETMRAGNPDVDALTRRLVDGARRGADEVAETVFQAVRRREFRILPDPEGRAAWRLKRLAPWPVYLAALRRTARRMLRPRRG